MWDIAAYAQETTAPATQAAPDPWSSLTSMAPMLIIFFAIMWFLMIRPEQKRKQERERFLTALAKNDRVITMGGLCGTIVGLSEQTVVLRISDEPLVKVEVVRQAISKVVKKDEEKK